MRRWASGRHSPLTRKTRCVAAVPIQCPLQLVGKRAAIAAANDGVGDASPGNKNGEHDPRPRQRTALLGTLASLHVIADRVLMSVPGVTDQPVVGVVEGIVVEHPVV